MYTCPHCSSSSISGWRKFGSAPLIPARCSQCGGECMASGWGRTVAALGSEVLLWVSIILSFFIGSVYGLLAYPMGMLALAVAVNGMFPLVAIDARLTVARHRAKTGFLLALAVLILV